VAELHEGVEQFPRFRVVGAEDLKIDFEFLVDSFYYSISLWIICHGLSILIPRGWAISLETCEENCGLRSDRKESGSPKCQYT